MKEMKKRLKNGEVITLTNDAETYECEISHSESFRSGKVFKVFFNGAVVSISATWPPAERKIKYLADKYGLSEKTDPDNA